MTTPDVPHRFEVTLEVPGTADEVWHAIATEQGISAWMVPTELEGREGGALTFHMGPDAESRGRVTAFEPPRRFAYEEDWATLVGHPGADVTPLATEFLVEATSGGTCVVRVVTSAFGTGADWEHELWDEMETGWAPVLDNLRLYLAHFPGQHAATLWVSTTSTVAPAAAVAAVRSRLGVEAVGDAVAVRGITGVVERVMDQHVLVRLEGPVPGLLAAYAFGAEEGSGVHLHGHLFSDGAPAYVEEERAGWQAWLEDVAVEAASTPAAGA